MTSMIFSSEFDILRDNPFNSLTPDQLFCTVSILHLHYTKVKSEFVRLSRGMTLASDMPICRLLLELRQE